jgi:hypothetical protein
MTEQPVETEQQFLGNEPGGIAARFARSWELSGSMTTPAAIRQSYLPNGHRLPRVSAIVHVDTAEAIREAVRQELAAADRPLPGTPGADLMLTAEQHANSAVLSLSCGELDEGIAWLQSALAFAQNHRHAEEYERAGQ